MITYPDGKSTVTATAANSDTPFVFPKGEYDYSVTSVGYKTYRTGTQGIEIELEGLYSSGKTFPVL